jgi:hypothetical protein
MRYPPDGIRGMGGARASRWGRIASYAKEGDRFDADYGPLGRFEFRFV